jgi:hypothetical protein
MQAIERGKPKTRMRLSWLWVVSLASVLWTAQSQSTTPVENPTTSPYINCVTGGTGVCASSAKWQTWTYSFPTRGYHVCESQNSQQGGNKMYGILFKYCNDLNPATIVTGNWIGFACTGGCQYNPSSTTFY